MPGETVENHKIPVRMVGDTANIQTGHLKNISLKCYCNNTVLGQWMFFFFFFLCVVFYQTVSKNKQEFQHVGVLVPSDIEGI